MRWLQDWFQNKKIREKVLICFLTVIFMSLVTIGITYSFTFANAMTDLANDSTQVILEQTGFAVQTYINNIERVIQSVSEDDNIRTFCNPSSANADSIDMSYVRISIYKTLNNIRETYPEIESITIVSSDDRFVSNELFKLRNESLNKEKWYLECEKKPFELQLIVKPISRNLSYKKNVSTDGLLCMTKAIVSTDGEVIGAILVDSKLEGIGSLLNNVVLGKEGFVLIFDREENLIYEPVNSVAPRIELEWFLDQSGVFEKRILGENSRFIYGTIEQYGLKVVGVFSLTSTLKQVTNTERLLLIILLITFLTAIFISFFFALTLTKPLEKLCDLMETVRQGDMSVRFKVRYSDEVGNLAETFNGMLDKIEDLIRLVYKEQEKKRYAELNALQAQIKPHFLYNTLDTIHWMAKKYGADDIVYLVRCLTNLFRISLSKGSEIISIRDEVLHVENYLRIQKVRYDDVLSYEIFVDPKVEGLFIHKLILQPIVENALYHGIKAKQDGGMIRIAIRQEQDVLMIRVTDNGIGMEDEDVESLNKAIRDDKRIKSGYGLYNVNERIKLTYGENWGVNISSKKGEGTEVIIKYPLINSIEQIDSMRLIRG